MKNNKISCNGELINWGELPLNIDEMFSTNFLYQKIHTIEHRALHLATHIKIVRDSYKKLYDRDIELSEEPLSSEIERLLDKNRYHVGSVQVVLYLLPPADGGEPTRILSCEKQLLYMGYTLWHSAMKAVVQSYNVSLPQHQTAASLSAHTYNRRHATLQGADVGITANSDGEITSVGEFPIFAVDDKTIYTPSLEDGAADCVERRMGLKAALVTDRKVVEQPILLEQLREFDEMFFITTQGVYSIGLYSGRLLPNSAAGSIASQLNNFTKEPL